MKNKTIIIIGAGFSSLSAAAYLAKDGYDVTVLEKNSSTGGRARQYKEMGFTFDIGPTFYWMPDIFEKFFNDFGKKVSDYYELSKLNPAYQVFFGKNNNLIIGDNFDDIKNTFEKREIGSGQKLKNFINKAEENYKIAINDLVYKPGENILEIVSFKTFLRLKLFFQSIKKQISNSFKNEDLQKILEFPVLFLGAKPSNTPAFYNFMNYADLQLGTWHPKGGMYEVVKAMVSINQEMGVKIITNCSVQGVSIKEDRVNKIKTSKGDYTCNILLSGADYWHTEKMLPKKYRQYSEKFWSRKTFAPSALIFYVGFDKKLKNVSHHSLFFDTNFDEHAKTIYDTKKWPDKPLFYASFPSITDPTCSPKNKDSGIFLIPIATGIADSEKIREKYFEIIIKRLENITGQEVKKNILFKKSYCIDDFMKDYNSYEGNAYGLANTLLQTHMLRPRLKSNKVKNLYFTGQLTLPGPGVPPSIISGKIVSNLIKKYDHETSI